MGTAVLHLLRRQAPGTHQVLWPSSNMNAQPAREEAVWGQEREQTEPVQLHRTDPNSAIRDGLKLEITPMAADGRMVEHTGHFCSGWDENAVCLGCCNYTPRPMSTPDAYFLPAREAGSPWPGCWQLGFRRGPSSCLADGGALAVLTWSFPVRAHVRRGSARWCPFLQRH